MIRRLLAIALGVGLLGTAVAGPPPARAGEPWTIGSSSGLVAATFTSGTSGTDTALALLNRTSIADRLKLGPDASFILEALGFGGGYSQEATWPAGSDPAIRCPPTGSNLACTSNSDGSGRVLIPGPVRASLLARSVGARGSTSLTVAPGYRSLLYDLAVTAIGIALGATCTTGLAGASADEVAALAVQLLPEAVGVAAALRRNDRRAAGTELVALSERAVAVITAHALGSAVGGGLCIAAQTIPGLLEVKLAIAALRAVPPLVLLSASLVTGSYGATVTVSYGGGAGATAAPSETAGPSTAGVLADIASIGGGESFTCALLGSGSVACWGIDMKAAAGGSRVPDTRPIVVGGPLVDAATMATGGGQTCVVRRDGSVACWGDDEHGMLGDGSAGVRPDPFTVPGVAGATSVIGGFWHSCAILGDRTVTCWGQIWDGGTGTMVDMATPTPVGGLTDVVSLSAGQNYTCALRGDGSVACWGNGQYGQLGDGTTQARARPATVPGLSGAVAIAGEGDRVCVLLRDATVSCWGSFNDVQLDVRPVAISGLSNVTAIAGGQGFMCALLRDTTVTCWGSNGDGQLGDGTTQDRAQPVAVTGLSGVAAIGAGWYHACAILVDTTARCWGDNEFGQLGDGTTVNQAEPVPVLAPWDASIPTPTPSPTPSAGPVSAPAGWQRIVSPLGYAISLPPDFRSSPGALQAGLLASGVLDGRDAEAYADSSGRVVVVTRQPGAAVSGTDVYGLGSFTSYKVMSAWVTAHRSGGGGFVGGGGAAWMGCNLPSDKSVWNMKWVVPVDPPFFLESFSFVLEGTGWELILVDPEAPATDSSGNIVDHLVARMGNADLWATVQSLRIGPYGCTT